MPSTHSVPSALRDLSELRAGGGRGVYASTGRMFRDTVFGRDSLEVAEDLLASDPALVREVILCIARLQGHADAPAGVRSSEELDGRVHHEARERYIDGREVDPEVSEIITELAAKWGGTRDAMTYYGSIDATPLFVRLVDRYCVATGDTAILDEHVISTHGTTPTVREAALAAARLIVRLVDASAATSGLGVVEYARRNPHGLEYQGWRDGRMSMIHPARVASRSRSALPRVRSFDDCGELINPDLPMATIESQGVAYDALRAAARLSTDPAEAQRLAERADVFRERVIAAFWMPREAFFATAIDRGPDGAPRQVRAITAAAGELLDTEFFDGLDALRQHRFIGGIVRRILGPEFLTDAGIRTTSLRHRDQLDHVAYQGPFTVWHKQTYDIAKGLRRHGLVALAEQLENRILNAVNISGCNAEYIVVDGAGRLAVDPANDRGRPRPDVIVATNLPAEGQAWTVSAALAIKRQRGAAARMGGTYAAVGASSSAPADPFIRRLGVAAAGRVRPIGVISSRKRLTAAYESAHPYVVNRILGAARQTAFTREAESRWRDAALRRGGSQGPGIGLTG